jgi:purine-binding chemotaxis protein CheW
MTNEHYNSVEDGLLVATFLLGDAVFGIDAHQVQEVARVGDMTPVHHSPPYVIGIRNLRGRIVTVIDLRVRLELGHVAMGPSNRILIVDCQGEPLGLLVDRVADAVEANPDSLAPPPPNLHGVQSQNLRGVIRGNDRLVALLDLNALFDSSQQPGRVAA